MLGDFAFAIYDDENKTLFCARDHVGARPFFYAVTPDRFAFASHIPVLQAALPGFDECDESFLATALSDPRFQSLERTYFKGLRKLPPAHWMLVTRDSEQMEEYWRPHDGPDVRFRNKEDYCEALREILAESVADRLRGASQVGLHLSGGLDSSSVAALTTKALRAGGRSDPLGYSWHPLEGADDTSTEPGWTEAIRAHLNLQVTAPEASSEDLAALLRLDRTRQPDVRNLFHEAAVQRDAASHNVDLILSGWGGDEGISFNGRGYRAQLLRNLRLIKLMRQAHRPRPRELARQFRIALTELRTTEGDHPTPDQLAASYLRADFVDRVQPLPSPRVALTSYRRAQTDLLKLTSITGRLEDWAISGARRGITYAYPLLDRRVLDFAYGIPPDLYQGAKLPRALMRDAMAPLLPDTIRFNEAKREPIRVSRLRTVFYAALAQVQPEIAERGPSLDRARYVDVPRLAHDLAQPLDGDEVYLGMMRLAVQFLDF
ncbi:hypothetical protein GCM10009127_25990 [Alteraurantiacibacter aestuarii]